MTKKFTLVELLVVVGLLALLLSLIGPAFSRMMSGNRVSELAGNIKLGLEQAQSYAVGRHEYVAVIFPSGNMTYSDEEEQALFGGYRLATVIYDRKKQEVTFKAWVPDLDWKFPPEGARLVQVVSGSKNRPEKGEPLKNCVSKVSKVLSTSLIDVKNIKDDDGNSLGTTSKNCAIVFSPYGSVVGTTKDTLYFSVTEATINDKEILFRSTDKSGNPLDYMTVELNPFTGRAQYLEDDDD